MTNQGQLTVRDFIYLDVERTKSIFAQLEEGLVTQLSIAEAKTKQLKGEAGINIPALIQAAGGGRVIWETRDTETKTLHDHLYNHVEDRLMAEGSIVEVNDETFAVDDVAKGVVHQLLAPTSFVLVRGRVVLQNYNYLADLVQRLNDLAAFIVQASAEKEIAELPKAQRKQALKERQREMQLPKWMVDGFEKLFQTFYKDRLSLLIYPLPEMPEFTFVAHMVGDYVRDGIETALFRYGRTPPSPWTVFGQIASIPKEGEEPFSPSSVGGTDIEKSLQEVFMVTRDLEALAMSVAYPQISLIPIAVYRE